MRNSGATSGSVLFGAAEQVGVGRGLAELAAGRPVLITGGDEKLLTLPVEGLDADRLAAFGKLCAPQPLRLIVTARRAGVLGLNATGPIALQLAPGAAVAKIHALVTEVKPPQVANAVPAGQAATAAIDLVKLVQLLPSVLVADVTFTQVADLDLSIIGVEAKAVARFRAEATRSLAIAGEALVPLSSGASTRFVVFRDAFGDSPVAVVVGKPDPSKPVPVRLHSACLTGDVFGSRRCDCGDQLKLALARLEEAGGGVILYLAQEGRGVGLANKMRTYQLQEAGLDTVDANTTLGFDDDERDYGVAVRMLRILGYTRIVMLTNNPDKLDSLARSGIEIVGRMSIEGAIHADNLRYLTAKATRNGHHLGHLLASLKELPEANGHMAPLAP